MKLSIIAIVGMISIWSTAAGAISPPTGESVRASHPAPVETIACVGFRYKYRSFNSCMKANKFNAKHCNKICA
jgi:hypothetical protein